MNFTIQRRYLLQVCSTFMSSFPFKCYIIDWFAGATGFLGKVLVEKLLRSCTTIKKLYILIRKKNGKPALERFQAITGSKIFDRIRQENPLLLDKLFFFEGNIEEPNLGLYFRFLFLGFVKHFFFQFKE